MFADGVYSVDNVPIRLTAERLMVSVTEPIFRAVPHLLDFPSRRFWVDYDAEADVLYVSLERPQKATDSVMTDDGVLLRYRDDRLVGVTILEASVREDGGASAR